MKILFFAHLKRLIGKSEIELEMRDQATIAEFWEELYTRHPELRSHCGQVRLAVNAEFAGPAARLHNADEVALIPPVSGG